MPFYLRPHPIGRDYIFIITLFYINSNTIVSASWQGLVDVLQKEIIYSKFQLGELGRRGSIFDLLG